MAPSAAGDRPFGARDLTSSAWRTVRVELGVAGSSGVVGSRLSKQQILRFRCTSSGNPSAAVDISCNTPEFGQDFAPDNEIAVAVNPHFPDHVVAGSNDYYYRFNNSTGARQAIVPTGFFTSFDGGRTWLDGQVPMRSGNGAGDPSPAFVGKLSARSPQTGVVLMAQLENVSGQGGCCVAQGDVSVSRSSDGGRTWGAPVTVMKGHGAGIGPANGAVFWDKEWLTVDNAPGSPFYGRAYVTATRFLNGPRGSYAESPIYLSSSDDGGRTWTAPREISGSHPSCTFQSTGATGECDEDQFSIPETAPDGTLYVHFLNFQNEAAWDGITFDFDSQVMVVRSTDGGRTFSRPVPAVQLEDGTSDMPFSVIGRQTIWGHQIRWTPAGTISVSPVRNAAGHYPVTVVFADRGTPNPNRSNACVATAPGPPAYDPCNAGPGSDTDVYAVTSADGGRTWSARQLVDGRNTHQWFPWADHRSDGSLAVAWDEDTSPPPADTFRHVLLVGGAKQALGPPEHVDVSVTHWAGQYVDRPEWPRVCGPAGYRDGPVLDAEGKDCNVFHGDYTGLAVDRLDRVHVVWTGLNARAVSPQLDPYTGGLHDGFRQDAMYARR